MNLSETLDLFLSHFTSQDYAAEVDVATQSSTRDDWWAI